MFGFGKRTASILIQSVVSNRLKSTTGKGTSVSRKSTLFIAEEEKFAAHNYHPIPCVLKKGKGIYVWDVASKQYMDFLSAYSAVNQGHCHPKIVSALVQQASNLTLSSRAFHNNKFAPFAKYITDLFKYDKVLPMNSGAEAVETALKLSRKWAYEKKGVEADKAIIFSCSGNFHGRTLGVISMSTDPDARNNFGPYLPNVGPVCPSTGSTIRYGHIEDLEAAFEAHSKNLAAFLVEPIQGEAGIIIPPENYLKRCYELCKKHNVLFIADEIQTGLGRTGKLLAIDHEDNGNIKPDIIILGKALSGGVYPVSAVLANDDVMLCIQPGEHGSTFGGNPLASAVALEALKVLISDKLCENSDKMGALLNAGLVEIKEKHSNVVAAVRGRGLMCALEVTSNNQYGTAWDLCLLLKEHGLLAKPTHDHIIRLTPPLVINRKQVKSALDIIDKSLSEFTSK